MNSVDLPDPEGLSTTTKEPLGTNASEQIRLRALPSETPSRPLAPTRKHLWLAPFACLYQVGHIVRKGLARGASVDELVDDARGAQKEVDLLRRFEVTRM